MASKSVSVSSERLQLKALKITNPQEFKARDHCVLFFPSEVRYSLTETKLLMEDVSKVEMLDMVTVKDGSKKHKATLIHVGSEEDCKEELADLESKIKANKGGPPSESRDSQKPAMKKSKTEAPKSSAESDLKKESKKVLKLAKLVPLTSPQESDYHQCEESACGALNDLWKEEVTKKLDKILEILASNEQALKKTKREPSLCEEEVCFTPPERKRPKMTMPSTSGYNKTVQESPMCASQLMYKDVDLLSLQSGGDVKKYALKFFAALFTTEEMANGMIGPMDRAKTKGKVILEERRIDLLKQAIQEKFGGHTLTKKWSSIRMSCNQKCLDTRKKMVLQQQAPNVAANSNVEEDIEQDFDQ